MRPRSQRELRIPFHLEQLLPEHERLRRVVLPQHKPHRRNGRFDLVHPKRVISKVLILRRLQRAARFLMPLRKRPNDCLARAFKRVLRRRKGFRQRAKMRADGAHQAQAADVAPAIEIQQQSQKEPQYSGCVPCKGHALSAQICDEECERDGHNAKRPQHPFCL